MSNDLNFFLLIQKVHKIVFHTDFVYIVSNDKAFKNFEAVLSSRKRHIV